MLCYNTAAYKRLQRVLRRSCNYTTRTAKQRTGLYSGFSCNLSHSTSTNTRPTQAAIIPLAPFWIVSQRRITSSTYQIPPPRRTLHRSVQTAYYNKVYKGAAVPTCTGPARRLRSGTGSVWLLPPGGAVQQQGCGGRRGTIGGSRRISFSGFRPIANRGQQ